MNRAMKCSIITASLVVVALSAYAIDASVKLETARYNRHPSKPVGSMRVKQLDTKITAATSFEIWHAAAANNEEEVEDGGTAENR